MSHGRFHLKTLGELALYGPDHGVLEARKKPLLVLAYLATSPSRRVDRGTLAELFWGADRPTRAKSSLRQALHQLRSIAPGVILGGYGWVGLAADALEVDLWEFDLALKRGDLERALSHYGGPFLAACPMPGGREVTQWVESEAGRIDVGVDAALGQLAADALRSGRATQAVALAQRRVDHNPLSEGAVESLVLALRAAGDDVGALQAFERYRTVIALELGDEPGEHLRSAIAQIDLTGSTAPPTPHGAPSFPRAAPLDFDPPATSVAYRPAAGNRPSRSLVAAALVLLVAALALAFANRQASLRLPAVVVRPSGERLEADIVLTKNGLHLAATDVPGEDRALGQDGRSATAFNGSRGVDIRIQGVPGRSPETLAEPADERPLGWSPDGSKLLFTSGVADPRGPKGYRRDLDIVDVHTGRRWTLVEDVVAEGHRPAAWSPEGARIAVGVEVQGDTEVIVLRPDGAWEGAAKAPGVVVGDAAWSPDGTLLSFTCGTRPDLNICLMNTRSYEVALVAAGPGTEWGAAWLSDEHLAFLRVEGPDSALVVADLRVGSEQAVGAPHVIELRASGAVNADRVRAVLGGRGWRGLGARGEWIDAVALVVPFGSTYVGEWVDVDVHVKDRRGMVGSTLRRAVLRVGDTTVAEVLPGYQVRGRRPGTTRLVGGYPGWRTDTVELRVREVTQLDPPLLLTEDWGRGLQANRWRTYGDPAPTVLPGRDGAGDAGLITNGDENYTSGVASRGSFPASEGLTLEFWGKAPFSGAHFESLGFGLVQDLPRREDAWSPVDAEGGVALLYEGRDERIYCPGGSIPLPTTTDWRLFSLQVSPDGGGALLVDRQVVRRFVVGRRFGPPDSLRVVLFGASHSAPIRYGRLALYRGLRYSLDP